MKNANSSKSSKSSTQLPYEPLSYAYLFLRFIEKQALVQEKTGGPFLSTLDRSYWGVRLTDTVEVRGQRRSVEALFNANCRLHGVNANLEFCLNQLAIQGKVRSYNIKRKSDSKDGRFKAGSSMGVKYWTSENEKMLAVRGGSNQQTSAVDMFAE